MHSVADLVEPNIIEDLAIDSNFRNGSRIYDADRVTLTTITDKEVIATVGSKLTQPRTVHLTTDGHKLSWKCSCTSDVSNFCKHIVAAALATWDKAPSTAS